MKPTCFMSKATSVPQKPQTNHSQYSLPVEALNLIVESKSQSVELDNSTIESSRRKKSLQLYMFCGPLMSRCVTTQVSVNSQISTLTGNVFLIGFRDLIFKKFS